MSRLVFLSLCATLSLLGACKRSQAPKEVDACERAVRHVIALGQGPGSAALDEPGQKVLEKTLAECRKEGLTQPQADCIVAAKNDSELLSVRSCPAIAERRPGWLVVAPTDQELAEIKDMMFPPVGARSGAVGFRQLVSAGATTCGLAETGELQCWGQRVELPAGTFQQVGWAWHLCGLSAEGALSCAPHYQGEVLSFLPKEPLAAFSEGASHGCGVIKATGLLTCWSKDGWQGDGKSYEPAPGKFVSVVSGSGFSCALAADGRVQCMGQAPAPPKQAFRSLAVHGDAVCGLRPDGAVQCWGGTNLVAPPADKLKQLSCAMRHCCGLRQDGTAVCWGPAEDPSLAAPTGTFTTILAAGSHSCASGAGTTTCWGHGAQGQTSVPSKPGEHLWAAAQ